MAGRVEKFRKEREILNQKILARENINIKRFFGIDSAVYRDGALDAKTKELLGLVASTVLRCDDCITYHLIRCREEGVSDAEMDETMGVALVVGGSITIPHLRRAYAVWEELGGSEE
jgi:AhpD family alkylhydroperoxidase